MSATARQVRRSMNVGGENPEFFMRDFEGGIHNFPSREMIHDEDLWWCENIIPYAPGNLQVAPQYSNTNNNIAEATLIPSYVMGFVVGTTEYLFAAFSNGNGWLVNVTAATTTKIISGLLSTSPNQTYATPYGNLGVLIIDPNGYWDWNVTTANTLTPWNNSVTGATNTVKNTVASHTSLQQIVTTGAGVGGTFNIHYQVTSATINAAGTGYVVGDVLSFSDGGFITPATVVVTTVGGGGTVTGIASLIGGDYNGPTTGGPSVAIGPTGTAFGGTGTGATFTCVIQAFKFQVLTPGHGYANTDTVKDQTAVPTTIDQWTLTVSGVIGGTGISAYAGRVWIINGRTVYFTDIGSYNFFGGAGSFFTITDSWHSGPLTVIYAANNYLYIFSATAIDALSNVTVTLGVTSFSRINLVQGVGTLAPMSVFGYYRTVAFFHQSGCYLLTGAAPEKISEKISNVILASGGVAGTAVSGCAVSIGTEFAACFQVVFTDNITPGAINTVRVVTLVYFRKRWWVYSLKGVTVTGTGGFAQTSVFDATVNQTRMFYLTSASGSNSVQVYKALTTAGSPWILMTKLWDGGTPFHEKQPINAAIAGLVTTTVNSGVTFTVDTEHGSSTQSNLNPNVASGGYQFMIDQAQLSLAQQFPEGSQYLGLTLLGGTINGNFSALRALALRGKTERRMLE